MITPTTSQGLMGLPHFKTSRAAMELYEPIYQNLFTVQLKFPNKLGLTNDESNLILEGITKVAGLDTNKVPASGTTQNYKFAQRRFADSGPQSTVLNIAFDFEINLRGCEIGKPNMYTLRALRKWTDMIYDPLTGRQGIKSDYVADYAIVTMHDKAQHPFWQWTLYNIWPTKSIPVPNLDYTQKSQIYKVTGFDLACDYWDEVML
jgi:hypothetical protein